MEKRTQTERFLIYFLLLLPLLLFRDVTPMNELKYLSIADESIRNGYIWTMFNHGIQYADKPPLYIWLVMGIKLLLGRHSVFLMTLFSILPAFGIIWIFNKWCEKELNPKFTWASEIAMMTTGYFIGGAVVLRMDMLMTLFIVLALWTFYRQINGDGRLILKIAFPLYVFLAIFTKGPVGFFAPLLCTVVWLAVSRKLKDFFHYWGLVTWGILILLCGFWWWMVYREGGMEYINDLLFHQTVGRSIDSWHHKGPWYYYLYSIWYMMAPWSLLTIGVIVYGLFKKVRLPQAIRFFLVCAATIFVMLSFVSSKLQIYMLPAFPFINYAAFYILQEIPSVNPRLSKFSDVSRKVVAWAASIILVIIFIGGCFVTKFNYRLGFKEVAAEALKSAEENGIDEFCFHNIRMGANMDVFIGKELRCLTDEEFADPQQIIGQDDRGVIIFTKDEKGIVRCNTVLKDIK